MFEVWMETDYEGYPTYVGCFDTKAEAKEYAREMRLASEADTAEFGYPEVSYYIKEVAA